MGNCACGSIQSRNNFIFLRQMRLRVTVFYLLLARATVALVGITDFYHIHGKGGCGASRYRSVFFISGEDACGTRVAVILIYQGEGTYGASQNGSYFNSSIKGACSASPHFGVLSVFAAMAPTALYLVQS